MKSKLQQANELRKSGESEQARQVLLELSRENPDDAEIAYNCAAVHDNLGLEAEAVPFYERAIELGLSGKELEGAILGLGSTYRCLGQLESSVAVLEDGVRRFPNNWGIKVFLAMTYHEAGRSGAAMEILLGCLAETSSDASVQEYKRAIALYAEMFGAE